ncbi:DUF7218 family protein [Nocardioides sp. CPCC 205120]|uniref:DUF7218 family protein n=1 Tax=Nocardioides sp. CPCC 205120 TaxID=3406462 RepID=UPI003B514C67
MPTDVTGAERPTRHWLFVLSREDALRARAEGRLRLSATGEGRLRRTAAGDGVVVYSPRERNKAGPPVRRFTAAGFVRGDAPYQLEGDVHGSWCIDVELDAGGEPEVQGLLGELSFVRDAPGWGVVFRPGFLEVSPADHRAVRDAVRRAPTASALRSTAPATGTKEDAVATEKRDPGPSVKNKKVYEDLRDDGASKEKAARIANATARDGASKVGKRGGSSPAYEEWTVDDLRGRAKELGLSGYSGKRKDELIEMLRDH